MSARPHQSSFSVQIEGHGSSMLLIPGLASSGAVWKETVAHERNRFECHVLTLAGFAGQPPVAPPMLPKIREAIADYIRARHLQRPAIVGHSLGGVLALDLAANHPELVGALVIVDSSPYLPAFTDPDATPGTMRDKARAIHRNVANASSDERRQEERTSLSMMMMDPARVDMALEWAMSSDPNAVGEAIEEIETTDLRPELSRIRSPTLVIGTWIEYAPYAQREQILRTFEKQYASLPDVRIVLADHARHYVMFDDPQFLFAEMDAFLSTRSTQNLGSSR